MTAPAPPTKTPPAVAAAQQQLDDLLARRAAVDAELVAIEAERQATAAARAEAQALWDLTGAARGRATAALSSGSPREGVPWHDPSPAELARLQRAAKAAEADWALADAALTVALREDNAVNWRRGGHDGVLMKRRRLDTAIVRAEEEVARAVAAAGAGDPLQALKRRLGLGA